MKLKDYEYYRTDLGVLYCGDCLEIMKLLLDKSVDLVITDPPYGLGKDGQKECKYKNPKHNRKAYDFLGWDNGIPRKSVFEHMFRISRNQIIWGGNYFVEYLKSSMGWLVWDKGQDLNQSDCELAYTSFNKALKRTVINRAFIRIDGAEHPTQKPLKLIKWCIRYAEQTNIILDPFLGSGTTAVACEQLGRRWIGIEISEKYCEIAKQRIKAEADQVKLL